jgi:DNA-binding winged helix-turn-helix (wHTH) protein
MNNDGSAHRVRFGAYEADFHTQELWNGETKLKLGRQPFQILEMLVASPGQLVTREDLQRRLWPEGHFVDSTHGLNAAINKLRDVLHDSADQPRYIETLPRRGYRFIGTVESTLPVVLSSPPVAPEPVEQSDSSVEPIAATQVVPQWVTAEVAIPIPKTRRWPILLTASFALVVGSMIGIALTGMLGKPDPQCCDAVKGSPRTEPPLNVTTQEELKAAQGNLAQAQKKLFAPKKSAAPEESLFQPEPHALLQTADFRTIVPGNTGNAAPQFSPDGTRIAFMSNRSGPWQIWMSNADGSNPVQISRTSSAGTPRWSPDGQSIAFDAPDDGMTSVFIAPIHHPENAHPIAEGRVPSFSRDGKYVYYASDRTDGWQVWKVPVAGGPEIQLTTHGGFAALESADGNLYYSKSDGQYPEIWKVAVKGGGDESALSPLVRPRTWSSWTVTKDGILLAADLPDGKTHLSLYDPVRATMHELVSLHSAPHWMGATADGKKVVINDAAERQITMLDNLR